MEYVDEEPEDSTETELLTGRLHADLKETKGLLWDINKSISENHLTMDSGVRFGIGLGIAAIIMSIPAAFVWAVLGGALAGLH